jgi:LysR family transcriptional regulator, hypochlorite-specific transcription factor HypT
MMKQPRQRQSLDLDWLEDFLEVVRLGSFTRAADLRGVTQPSLSRRIQNLELWVGTDLLDRDLREGTSKSSARRHLPSASAPLELTEAGKFFHPLAYDIIASLRRARDDALVATDQPAKISLHTLHTLAATFVPMFIHHVRKALRDDDFEVKMSVKVGHISDCVEALSFGATPFIISYQADNSQLLFPIPKEIESIRIAQDRLIPVCSTKNYDTYLEIYESGRAKIPFATYSPGTYLSHLVEAKVKHLDLKTRLEPVADAQMADTLRNLVREEQGIAWVLHSTAQNALNAKELRAFEFGRPQESYIDLDIMLFRATDYTSPNIERIGPTIERIWKISKTLEKELSPNAERLYRSNARPRAK